MASCILTANSSVGRDPVARALAGDATDIILRLSATDMPLSPGTRLGHYDVTDLLGEGGMGRLVAVRPVR